MPNLEPKLAIQNALQDFVRNPLAQAALTLLETLGYRSDKRLTFTPNNAAQFRVEFDPHSQLNIQNARLKEWKSVDFLFQITGDELAGALSAQGQSFRNQKVDQTLIQSYLFFAIELSGPHYTRTDLATITREVNKLFPMPAMLLFKHGDTLTLAIITRRINKRDGNRDVLEKVTLIKDIRLANPHRAHTEILLDLSLAELAHAHSLTNFVELQRAWEQTLDTSELNKKFFREISYWYFSAIDDVTFPAGAGGDLESRNASNLIRLITRLIFVWFLKEKGLVPIDFFDERRLKALLTFNDSQGSTYYKAILQNLFFATLNTEMNRDKPGNRKFRGKNKQTDGRDQHHGISTVYRYENLFKDPQTALNLFADVPFLNGGLFECLDRPEKDNPGKIVRVDGFSDRSDNPLRVPDALFFGEEHDKDLNEIFATKNKHYPVRGLIHIFNHYKFTIEENTPLEEEVALDPELLGKVFENLLAAFNPETGTTARKQTGSFYTPRDIVNYMVDEALLVYLESCILLNDDIPSTTSRLRHLLAYANETSEFSEAETLQLIDAIHKLKVFDPACGSGAFPMGMLHKLVFLLKKLDPMNNRWREIQKQKAILETEAAYEIGDVEERRQRLMDIDQAFENNASNYGRKLYLIENCIYGVDIQPIAVQIAKLRFFISLIVEQNVDDSQPNRGVRPLPNLETKFVAANTLIGIERPQQLMLRNPLIDQKEKELTDTRRKHFSARTPATKRKYREQDQQLRAELASLLKKDGWGSAAAAQLATWDPYNQNSSAEFFDIEWMFGLTDGFDVTIGNPPYIGERGHKEVFRDIAQNAWGKKYYQRKMDLFYFFFHFALDNTKENGQICFITTNYFITADGASKLRKAFKEQSTVRKLINFNEFKIFESALGQHNLISLLRACKSISPQNDNLRFA